MRWTGSAIRARGGGRALSSSLPPPVSSHRSAGMTSAPRRAPSAWGTRHVRDSGQARRRARVSARKNAPRRTGCPRRAQHRRARRRPRSSASRAAAAPPFQSSRAVLMMSPPSPFSSAARRARESASSSASVSTTRAAPAIAAAWPARPSPQPSSTTVRPCTNEGQCVTRRASAIADGHTMSPAPYKVVEPLAKRARVGELERRFLVCELRKEHRHRAAAAQVDVQPAPRTARASGSVRCPGALSQAEPRSLAPRTAAAAAPRVDPEPPSQLQTWPRARAVEVQVRFDRSHDTQKWRGSGGFRRAACIPAGARRALLARVGGLGGDSPRHGARAGDRKQKLT